MTSNLSAVPLGLFNYNANDQLSTDIYNSNGNTTSSGGVADSYDFENHLTSYGLVNLVYDGDGNRVSETIGGTTTGYVVDSLNPTGYPQVLEEIANGAVQPRVPLLDSCCPGEQRFNLCVKISCNVKHSSISIRRQ